jgi:hypothetical protein
MMARPLPLLLSSCCSRSTTKLGPLISGVRSYLHFGDIIMLDLGIQTHGNA